jgi:hypothetical protein
MSSGGEKFLSVGSTTEKQKVGPLMKMVISRFFLFEGW